MFRDPAFLEMIGGWTHLKMQLSCRKGQMLLIGEDVRAQILRNLALFGHRGYKS